MAAHIKTELAASTYTAIIFQLLDNNLYFACNEEGSLALAQRDRDGCYHVEGDLVVGDRAAQYAVMKLCSPLWDTATGLHMVIFSPLPRYVKDGCCEAEGHIPNRADPDFYQKLKQDLTDCSLNIKDFLFTAGMRNGRVMDPQRNLRGMSVALTWGNDPVHPKEEVYDSLAEGMVAVKRSCNGSSTKRKRKDSDGDTSRPTYERPGTGHRGRRDAGRDGAGGCGGSGRGGAGSRGGSGYSNPSARGRSDGWQPAREKGRRGDRGG